MYPISSKTTYTNYYIAWVLCDNDLHKSPDIFFITLGHWTMHPLHALFHSYGDYLNFSTNAVTLLAQWYVPLKYTPYFITIIGLLFQLLPLFLIVNR